MSHFAEQLICIDSGTSQAKERATSRRLVEKNKLLARHFKLANVSSLSATVIEE